MTPSPAPVARAAGPADVAALARLHREVFPTYESSRLGAGFARALLARYLRDPAALVLVVDGPSGPVGYLVGAPPAVQRQVNDALAARAAVAALGQAVRSPRQALRGAASTGRRARRVAGSLLGRLRGRTTPGSGPASEGGGPAPGATVEADTRVVLVGVAAAARGGGVVDGLLQGFADGSVAAGHRSADLLVVGANQAARRAYARHGWRDGGDAGGGTVRFVLDLRGGPGRPHR